MRGRRLSVHRAVRRTSPGNCMYKLKQLLLTMFEVGLTQWAGCLGVVLYKSHSYLATTPSCRRRLQQKGHWLRAGKPVSHLLARIAVLF